MYGTRKRKRPNYALPFNPPRRVGRPARRPPAKRFRPGYNRTAGFYGRYRGSGAEYKFYDGNFTFNPVATTGSLVSSINTVPQGTTESDRIGRKIVIRSIFFRFAVDLDKTSNAPLPDAEEIRIIVYLDTQTNGAAISGPTDILMSSSVRAYRELANSKRFKIMMDKNYVINPSNITQGVSSQYSYTGARRLGSYYKTKCNIPIEFDSTTGVISEIKSNNIGILAISYNGIGILRGNIRIRYTDN